MLIPLQQNLLIERNEEVSETVMRKSGIVVPGQVQSMQDEGLVLGTILYAPKDQNMLIDKTRPINEASLAVGDKVWYSKYSTSRILDDRDGFEGKLLDIVALEDVRVLQK